MESLRKGRGIWKVRASPSLQMRYGGRPPTSRPSSRTDPSVGANSPAMTLNVVLLPEPLGPIRPRISPSASSKERFLTAVNPPKRLVSPCTESTQARPASLRVGMALGQGQDRVGRLERVGPDHLRLVPGVLHHDRRRALVLARHLMARAEELHAVTLDRPADRNVAGERRLAQRVRRDAAVLLDGARKHVGEEDPGLVEA